MLQLEMRTVILLVLFVTAAVSSAIPKFAREYEVNCTKCHVHGAKLTSFGETFAANGYKMPGMEKKLSAPISAWVSLQNQNRTAAPKNFQTAFNRVELISGGRFMNDSASYFVEWRVLSRELQSDGTGRDRSGRFEDAFVNVDLSPTLGVQIGQFRGLSQIDVSRRIGLGEPIVFSTSLPGTAASTSRLTSLRGFSVSGRSPGIRMGYANRPDPTSADGIYATAALMFPGEFSIPLSEEAEVNASNELEFQPKGVFAEVYKRSGPMSIGINGFSGDNGRNYLGVAGQAKFGNIYLEGGFGRAEINGSREYRYSLTADWIRSFEQAYGIRIEQRQFSGQRLMLAPYASWSVQCGPKVARFVAEARLQDHKYSQFVFEVGFQF
jgi:hypothetical protein